MKKTVAYGFVSLLVLCLIGCVKSQPLPEYVEPNFTRRPVTVTASYSDVEGISVQAAARC